MKSWSMSDTCPIRGCGEKTRSLKRHLFEGYLSEVFILDPPREMMEDPGFHRFKWLIVMQLARCLMEQLFACLRQKARVSHNLVPLPKEMEVLRAVGRVMGWPTQTRYVVNAAECLLHSGC